VTCLLAFVACFAVFGFVAEVTAQWFERWLWHRYCRRNNLSTGNKLVRSHFPER